MQLSGEKHGVLIVDDEPQVAAALADALEEDFRIRTASAPEEALTTLRNDKSIAVVISDQRMPGMTGDELLASAKRVSMATRLLITAYADIGAVVRAVNDGHIFGYIAKPWQPHDLMLTVSRAAEYCDLKKSMVEERELLRQLMDSSPDAIAIKDREHRYVRLNALEAEMLGAGDSSAVTGSTAAAFIESDRAAARHGDEDVVIRDGRSIRDRLEHIPANGSPERWLSSKLAPIRDGLGEVAGLVTITRDVTESRRLDAMKDEFIATVRHELRTPLTAIRGALGLLRGGAVTDVGHRARKLVDISYAHSGRLLSMINDLLDSEALETGAMQFDRRPVALAAIVSDAVRAARDKADGYNVSVTRVARVADVKIAADAERLRQVLMNLIANAIEATPSGGSVSVVARSFKDGTARISVRDRGPGVPEDFRPRLFKRFSQADSSDARRKGGIGLGLHIARGIVEAHGGSIGFQNHPDGAEFHIDLPVLPNEQRSKQRLRRRMA
jgi:PAS domain S-box-containing protein